MILALVIGAGLWLRHRAGLAPGAGDRPAGAGVLRASGDAGDRAAGEAAPAEEPAGPESSDPASEQPAVGDALPVSIEGRVTDASGNGVPHARVRAVERTALADVIAGNKKLLDVDPFEALRTFQELLAGIETSLPSCTSALDGRYALRGLPDGDHRVAVTHEEFLTHAEENWILVQAGRKARYDVELVAGQTIAGLVRNTKGAPVAGVRIQATPIETARPSPARASGSGATRGSNAAVAPDRGIDSLHASRRPSRTIAPAACASPLSASAKLGDDSCRLKEARGQCPDWSSTTDCVEELS